MRKLARFALIDTLVGLLGKVPPRRSADPGDPDPGDPGPGDPGHRRAGREHASQVSKSFLFRKAILSGFVAFLGFAALLTEAKAAPFAGCTSDMYLTQNNNGAPTTLYQFDTSNNPFVYDVLGTANYDYNATAFNPADNYLYATRWNGSSHELLRVSSDGSVEIVGNISGGGINTSSVRLYTGEIGPDGFYYVKHGTTGNAMFRVDLTTKTATLITLSQSMNIADWGWYDGFLWAKGTVSDALFKINPTTGQVTVVGNTGLFIAFGAMISATNGIFGASNDGGFYRFDPLTGQPTLISGSPASAGNDGAKCVNTPLYFPADLSIFKTDGSQTYTPGGQVVYTIVVTNLGPFGVQNALVNDPLPAGITTASWTCGSPTGGAVCGEASGTGAIVDQRADLPFEGTLTYTLTMDIPADFNGQLVNTATVTNPPDVPDPNLPNESTDTDDVTTITLQKLVTNDDGGTSLVSDFTLSASGPTPISGVSGSATVTKALVEPGGYSLSESGPVGYTASYSCSINEAGAVVGESFTLAFGDDAVCTITNDDIPPAITIAKVLTGESGTVANQAEAGETLTYQITLTNAGGQASTNYGVTDAFDANTTFVSADNGGVQSGTDIVWSGLTVPAQVGTIPGTLVLTVQVTVNDPIPAGVTDIANLAYETGTTPPDCTTNPSDPRCVTTPAINSSLDLVKSAAFEDGDGDGAPDAGEVIRYTFTVKNTGNVVLADVSIRDPGPLFKDQTAANALFAFTSATAELAPGGEQVFTATYPLGQQDIDTAAGIDQGVKNTAVAFGYANGTSTTGTLVESKESKAVVSLPAVETDISIIKVANIKQIKRGEKAPFTITVTNNSSRTVGGLTVTDVVPSGFRFVEGSATVDGGKVTPVVVGQRVRFENISLGPDAEIVIKLQILALSTATPGKHTNTAIVTDPGGDPVAPPAKADVEIMVEPVFDCGDVIGKVFDDVNQNGYQDEGEPGLPGVRVVTVNGLLVTTDKHGRFHVACADLPDSRIGSNFVMKLDTRTLPTGYRLTTENPRVIRLTAGKMSKLNFGASIGRVVRLDLTDQAFKPGTTELKPEWRDGFDQLMEVLEVGPSTLRIGYAGSADGTLSKRRMEAVEKEISDRWRSVSGRYDLNIEIRQETAQ